MNKACLASVLALCALGLLSVSALPSTEELRISSAKVYMGVSVSQIFPLDESVSIDPELAILLRNQLSWSFCLNLTREGLESLSSVRKASESWSNTEGKLSPCDLSFALGFHLRLKDPPDVELWYDGTILVVSMGITKEGESISIDEFVERVYDERGDVRPEIEEKMRDAGREFFNATGAQASLKIEGTEWVVISISTTPPVEETVSASDGAIEWRALSSLMPATSRYLSDYERIYGHRDGYLALYWLPRRHGGSCLITENEMPSETRKIMVAGDEPLLFIRELCFYWFWPRVVQDNLDEFSVGAENLDSFMLGEESNLVELTTAFYLGGSGVTDLQLLLDDISSHEADIREKLDHLSDIESETLQVREALYNIIAEEDPIYSLYRGDIEREYGLLSNGLSERKGKLEELLHEYYSLHMRVGDRLAYLRQEVAIQRSTRLAWAAIIITGTVGFVQVATTFPEKVIWVRNRLLESYRLLASRIKPMRLAWIRERVLSGKIGPPDLASIKKRSRQLIQLPDLASIKKRSRQLFDRFSGWIKLLRRAISSALRGATERLIKRA